MGSFKHALAHAFAVGPGPHVPAGELPAVLERVARGIVARGLETPAILALESLAPLGFLGGQAMLAVWPLVRAFVPGEDWRETAACLEERETLHRFAERIETLARGERERS
ncbi:MAG TPA: hypothetical protein VM285_11385 [Polyangia bacterium]|nr:hypothetical protein [Polyangia bacterium]